MNVNYINPRKTQLVDPKTFSPDYMVFAKPRILTIKEMGKVPYMQIPIGYKNDDGSIGELCLLTEKLFSFGISPPFQNLPTAHYSLSLSLHDRMEPTDEQLLFTDTVTAILKTTREFLESMKLHPDLEAHNLKITTDRLDSFESAPIKWKKLCKETKKRVDISPLMNVKLIVKNTDGVEILSSHVVDTKNRPIQLHEYLNKFCNAQCVLKFDGVFIGGMLITMQIKLVQGVLEPIPDQAKPRFHIPMLETVTAYDTVPSIIGGSPQPLNHDGDLISLSSDDGHGMPDHEIPDHGMPDHEMGPRKELTVDIPDN